MNEGHLDKILLSSLSTLGDGCGYLASFAKTHSDNAIAVTYDDDSSETEGATTFSYLGDTVDSNEAILKFQIVRITNSIQIISHQS